MGSRIKGMTTQEYRLSYNYRAEYFKRNPGLGRIIWFCSQCYKPLFGKKNVYVDHIVPLNKGGRNHVSNCTSICLKCNSSKSDKVDGRVLKGQVFKAFESVSSTATLGVGTVAVVGVGATARLATGTVKVGFGLGSRIISIAFRVIKGTVKLVTLPLRKGKLISRLFFLAAYVAAILYFLSKYTTVLNAWF